MKKTRKPKEVEQEIFRDLLELRDLLKSTEIMLDDHQRGMERAKAIYEAQLVQEQAQIERLTKIKDRFLAEAKGLSDLITSKTIREKVKKLGGW